MGRKASGRLCSDTTKCRQKRHFLVVQNYLGVGKSYKSVKNVENISKSFVRFAKM